MVKKIALSALASFFFFANVCLFGQLRINEVVVRSGPILPDAYRDYSDWIELKNVGSTPINVGDYSLARHRDGRSATALPDTVLLPGAHIVFRASGEPTPTGTMLRLTGGGSGIDSYAAYEGCTWAFIALPQSEDFTFQYRLRSLDRLHPFSRAGFMMREDTVNLAPRLIANLIDTYNGILLYNRQNVGDWAWQSPSLMSTDMPNGFIKLERRNNVLHHYATLNGEDWFFLRADSIPYSGESVFIGLAYGSGSPNEEGYAIFEDVRLNGRLLTPDDFQLRDIFSPIRGTFTPYREFHLPFTLPNGGVGVFLLDKDGTITDEMQVPAHPLDMSYGYRDDGSDIGFLSRPTFAKPNSSGFAEVAPTPVADKESGFYSEGTVVIFSADGRELRYTTDGSIPTAASPVLDEEYRITTSHTLRVRAFGAGEAASRVLSRTFVTEEHPGIHAVSLTIPEEDLHSYTTGIFNERRLFERFEHTGSIDLWDAEGEHRLTQDVGIRLHGYSSRLASQRSLRVYSRGAYGNSSLSFPTFPGTEDFTMQRLIVRNNGGNGGSFTFLRNGYAMTLARRYTDMLAPGYHPAIMYLNGQYQGIYSLHERFDERYLEQWYGIDRNSIELLEDNGTPSSGSDAAFLRLMDTLRNGDFSGDDAMEKVSEYIDLPHLFRYVAFYVISANTDWPHGNTKFWRSPQYDNRWRWELNDFDWSFAHNNRRHNTLQHVLNSDSAVLSEILRLILVNPEMKHSFVNAHADLLNTVFLPATTKSLWRELDEQVRPFIERHAEFWDGNLRDWDWESEHVGYFLDARSGNVRSHLMEGFDIGSTATVTLAVFPEGAGRIRINSVRPAELPWSGIYFGNCPVEIEVQAHSGYEFIGWERGGSDTLFHLDDFSDTTLLALFRQKEVPPSLVFNEIMYRASPNAPTEDWVELYNPTDEDTDLSGYLFRDDRDDRAFVIPDGTVIAAGGFLILAEDTLAFRQIHSTAGPLVGNFPFGLGRQDQVRLFTPSGFLVDSVAYTNTAPWYPEADATGLTLELIHWNTDNTLPENWKVSLVDNGTPGAMNSVTTSITIAPPPVDGWLGLLHHPIVEGRTPTLHLRKIPAQAITLRLYDLSGVLLREQRYETRGREQFLQLSLGSLSSGSYFIHASTDNPQYSTTLPLLFMR